ncbi:MAG: hypothetical protein QOH09_3423 [Pseudonocardiales bacterium]|jgi:hypothetical protein|nr:hypothetical protein [Pseudonocardiales bacterium]
MHLKIVLDIHPVRTPCVIQQLTPGDDATSIVH